MLVLSLMLSLAVAWEFPFRVSFPSANTPGQKVLDVGESGTRPLRIAIIGAGAGGSSAAFWISKARERHGVNVHIDVYEKENYIGGREWVIHDSGRPRVLSATSMQGQLLFIHTRMPPFPLPSWARPFSSTLIETWRAQSKSSTSALSTLVTTMATWEFGMGLSLFSRCVLCLRLSVLKIDCGNCRQVGEAGSAGSTTSKSCGDTGTRPARGHQNCKAESTPFLPLSY
jgi:NAD(P)-binding Rossmann-like domain